MITEIYSEVHLPATGGTLRKSLLAENGFVSITPDHLNYRGVSKISKVEPVAFRRSPFALVASWFFKCRDRMENLNDRKFPPDISFESFVIGYLPNLRKGVVRELESYNWYLDGMPKKDIFTFEEFPEIFTLRTGIEVGARVENKGSYPDLNSLYTEAMVTVVLDRFDSELKKYGDHWGIPELIEST